jgi:hypothetical protein
MALAVALDLRYDAIGTSSVRGAKCSIGPHSCGEDAQCWAAARTDRRDPAPRGVALRVLLLFYRCKL